MLRPYVRHSKRKKDIQKALDDIALRNNKSKW
jgi:hypothetical protein